MSEIVFDESLILELEGIEENTEALTQLTDYLLDKGYVKNGYKEAILEREAMFPTGLSTGVINIAIPHADTRYVNQAAICVGILKKPVKFSAMDEPDHQIDVNIIIVLALKEAHGHLEMLQKVVELIKDQDNLKKIVTASDTKPVYDIISSHLLQQ